jgi:hypothetical protein
VIFLMIAAKGLPLGGIYDKYTNLTEKVTPLN